MEGKTLISVFLLVGAISQPAYAGASPATGCAGAFDANCHRSMSEGEQALFRELDKLPGSMEKIQVASRYLGDVDPFSIPVREHLLNIYIENSEWSSAYSEFQTIRRLDRDHYTGEAAAEILIKSRRFEEALRFLDPLLQKVPGNLIARRLRAVARYEAKDFRGALNDLRHFTGSSEDSDALDLARAKILQRLGQVGASRDLLRGLDLPSLRAPEQTFEVGLLAEKLEELELAERSYRLSYERQSGEPIALAFARVLQMNAKGDEAEHVLQSAVTRWPNSDSVMSALLENLLGKGKMSRAGALLGAWQEKFPERPWIRQERAKLKARLGVSSPEAGSPSVVGPSAEKKQKNGKRRMASGSSRVRVRPGETLMTLSYRLFGTHQRWKEIWKLNRGELRSPSSIAARMLLKVPAAEEDASGGGEE